MARIRFWKVWRAIREAQREAQKEWPVEVRWNLDAIRQFGPEHVMEVARVAAKYVGDGAISFGIGGDEVRGPALGCARLIVMRKMPGCD